MELTAEFLKWYEILDDEEKESLRNLLKEMNENNT